MKFPKTRLSKKFGGNEVKYSELKILLFNEKLCGPFSNGNKNFGPVIQLCWTLLV